MAVVQYTGIVNQLRGKLNGSVFNKGKTSFTMQKKQQPPAGWRGNQLVPRSRFNSVQRRWKELTPAQRNAWQTTANENPATDRFGNQVVLSGYNQFIKANIYNLQAVNVFNFDGYPAPAPGVSNVAFNVSPFAFSSNELGETIASGTLIASRDTTPGLFRAFLFVSLPQSNGVTVYHKGWRSLTRPIFTVSISSAFTVNLGNRYPMAVGGTTLFLLLRVIHMESGSVVGEFEQTLIVPEAPVISGWNVDYQGIGNLSTITIGYTPAYTGWPPFYLLRVYVTGASATPPPESAATTFVPGASEGLRLQNTYGSFITIPQGLYVGYKAELRFAQSGRIVSTNYTVVQG